MTENNTPSPIRKRIYIDVETTGLYSNSCGIVQIGGIIEIDGKVAETFDLRPQPFLDDDIYDDALKVTGLTKEEIWDPDKYEPPETVHKTLTGIMSKYIDRFNKKDKFHLLGYNVLAFDIPFMRAWFKKCGDKYFGSWFFHPPLDVMVIAAYMLQAKRHTVPNFQLSTVASALNLPWEDDKAHDAMYDIEITRWIMQVLETNI